MALPTHDLINADYSSLETRIAGSLSADPKLSKQLMLGAAYGMSKPRMKEWMANGIRTDSIESACDKDHLSVAEWRWAVAFRTVLEVRDNFYENASAGRKRQLEQHYQAIAGNDSAKGRKAAKVIAHWFKLCCDDAKPPSSRFSSDTLSQLAAQAIKQSGTATGRIVGKSAFGIKIDDPMNAVKLGSF